MSAFRPVSRRSGPRPAGFIVVVALVVVSVGAVLSVRLVQADARSDREAVATAVGERVGGDVRAALDAASAVASSYARDPDVVAIAVGRAGPETDRVLTTATAQVQPNCDIDAGAVQRACSVASIVGENGMELARALGDRVFAPHELEAESRPFTAMAGGLNADEGFTVLVGPTVSPDTGETVVSAAARIVGTGAVFQVEVLLDDVLAAGSTLGATLVEDDEPVAGAEVGDGPAVTVPLAIDGLDWAVRVDVAQASSAIDVSPERTSIAAVIVAALLLLVIIMVLAVQQRLLFRRAQADPSTGLANRHQLVNEVEQRLAEGQEVTLMVFSLIRFRRVVEVLGHAHGDRLLREVAQRLRTAAPKEAMLARSAEEELAVVLVGAAWQEDAAACAEELRAAMTSGLIVDGVPIDLGARVGLALAPDHARDTPALLRRAASALRAAALRHRDVLVYTPDLDLDGRHQLTLAGELEQAIRDGSIDIELQPKLSLVTDEIVGMEALARWRRPSGDVSPMDFIPLAEATGRIGPLTMRVIDRALEERARLAEVGDDVYVAANLSAVSLSDPDLVSRIEELLERHATRPDRLVLELTETSIMADPDTAVATLQRLQDLGVAVSVDDFGTGYSSMSYLTQLPVDEVKIDRSFVGTEDADLRVVRSVVQLAHDFDLRVVAEGVESGEMLERLRELGCDEAQGYHIARPMPGRELRTWLAARRAAVAESPDGILAQGGVL